MRIEKVKDWVDLVLKVVSILAIITGGIWAYYQFKMADTDASNIELMVSADVVKYSKDLRLMVIHVKPKNIGKVPVSAQKEGLVVTVRKIPTGLKHGVIDLEKSPEMYKADVLKKFTDGYLLEPGVQYDEMAALLVPEGLYSISAVMDLGENTEVDHMAIVNVQ